MVSKELEMAFLSSNNETLWLEAEVRLEVVEVVSITVVDFSIVTMAGVGVEELEVRNPIVRRHVGVH